MAMKYKLINKITREEHLCEKVSVDGFDYYVSDEKVSGMLAYNPLTNKMEFFTSHPKYNESGNKVIATNNPNIDIPKVINEVWINKEKNQELIDLINHTLPTEQLTLNQESLIYHHGKPQETHPFSEEDMIEFAMHTWDNGIATKESLQLWREQQPKTLYYE